MLRSHDREGWFDLTQTVDATTEPVTLAEAKQHARIEITDDDTLISGMITGARQLVERMTNRALITQTWQLTLDQWPGANPYGPGAQWWDGVRDGALGTVFGTNEIRLRKTPFQSVSAITIYNEDGSVNQVVDNTKIYFVVPDMLGGRVIKRIGQIWPPIVPPIRLRAGIVISFLAGYGSAEANVPFALRQVIKDIIAEWYENREATAQTSRWQAPLKTLAIINSFKVTR